MQDEIRQAFNLAEDIRQNMYILTTDGDKLPDEEKKDLIKDSYKKSKEIKEILK